MKVSGRKLQPILDQLYDSYLEEFRRSPSEFFAHRKDPISFPHRYSDFYDIEASAFLAATFAYGKVQSLCAFVDNLLNMMQPSPYKFLRNGPDIVETLAPRAPYYRLQKTPDILGLLSMLAAVYESHDSLYAVFMQSYDKDSTIEEAVIGFVRRLYEIHGEPIPFLLPSPESGSPCKRLNLFLRWMVRRDGLDFGLWEGVSPAQLLIPLDTHIGRIAFKLGWITTPSLSWKKAEEVTRVLRKFNSADPVRYDFSLCHESISRSPWLQQIAGLRTRTQHNRNLSRNKQDDKARCS